MLIPKGFAWAIVDEEGGLINYDCDCPIEPVYAIYETRKQAKSECRFKIERNVG